MSIIPLEGLVIAKLHSQIESLETESARSMGLDGFVTVDNKAGRNEALRGMTRVRLFRIISVYENAPDSIKAYEGKLMHCVCMENEKENNIIVDEDSGEKLYYIPVANILGMVREN